MARQKLQQQLTLDPDIIERLKQASEQEGEAMSVIARRILRAHLPPLAKPAPVPVPTNDALVEAVA